MKAKEIRALRAILNVTQEEFAGMVGVARSTILRWEQEQSRPTRMGVRAMQRIKRRLEREELEHDGNANHQ